MSPTSVRIVYTLMVGARPAELERRLVDRNLDRHLDDRETAELGRRAQARIAAALVVTVDGKRVAPPLGTPEVGLLGAGVDASPFSVDVEAIVPVAYGSHTITVEDRAPADPYAQSEQRAVDSPTVRIRHTQKRPTGLVIETEPLGPAPSPRRR